MRALLALLLLSIHTAHAQLDAAWRKQPAIVVIATDGDPRIALVGEAIGYWNRVLDEAGSPFRLPAPVRAALPIPEEALQELSKAMTRRPLQAFAVQIEPGKRVVAIRSTSKPPLDQPNVARNLIAHELGHAIGLGHNAAAEREHFFPLTRDELRRLRLMYPPVHDR